MWRRVAVRDAWRPTEEALCLPGLRGTSQQHCALAQGRAQRQLIEGDALAASLRDLRACRLRETQGTNGELGSLIEALVASDGAADHSDLAILAIHELRQLLQRQGSLRP